MINHTQRQALIATKLSQITDRLLQTWKESPGSGLHVGQSGIALYLAYYARFSGEEEYLDEAMKIIGSCMSSLGENPGHYNLCSGFAGLAWTITHLVKENFFEADLAEDLASLDDYLEERVIYDISHNEYDFLHSGLGIGVYFLERYPDERSEQVLGKIIDALAQVMVEDEGWKTWQDHFSLERGDSCFNLGFAHGIPSIIGFLAQLKFKGLVHDKLDDLLNQSVSWLLEQRLPADQGSCFPNRKKDGEADVAPSRLAWCYGDPGLVSALWLAARATDNGDWEREALEILKHAAARRGDSARINDASFCHGAAGASHIFRRFYRYTELPALKEASEFWLNDALNNMNYQKDKDLWQYWRGDIEAWENDDSLLQGLAGIGLVLISALDEELSDWDRSFILS